MHRDDRGELRRSRSRSPRSRYDEKERYGDSVRRESRRYGDRDDRNTNSRRSRSRSPRPRRPSPPRRSRSRSPLAKRRRSHSPSRSRSRSQERRDDRKRRGRSESVSSRSSTSSSRKRRKKRKDKEAKRSKSEERERREKKERKKAKKERKEKKKHDTTAHWGKYGIISETDIFSKGPEFYTWLVEERKINPETISKDQNKKEFAKFVEDFNTATLPHEKYYNMEAYDRRMSALRQGEFVPPPDDAYDAQADLKAIRGAHKRKPVEQESYLSREQLLELRKVQHERIEAGKMKLLGMDVRQNMGVRMDTSYDG